MIGERRHTEREVTAALAEMNALCDRGNQELDNPPRWRLTLTAARSAHRRAAAALEAGPAADELRATFAGATARLERDEFDCETAELCEKWIVDVLRAVSSKPRGDEFTGVLLQAEAIFTRLSIPPATTPSEAFAVTISNHRLRYQLTVLLLITKELEGSNRGQFEKHREAIWQNAHPLQNAVREALRTRTKLDSILTGSGRTLSSSELIVLFMTCRDAAQWYADAGALLHEAIRRNPADLVALVLASGESPNVHFELVGKDNPKPPSDPVATLKHSQLRGLAASAGAVAARPDVPLLWSQYGKQLEQHGLSDWAADCYRRAIQLDPQRVDDLIALANVLVALGRRGEALDTFRAALPHARRTASYEAAELPVHAARAALLLAHDSGAETRALTEEQKRELRLAARRWLREWLTEWEVTYEGLQLARTDPAFRFVRHPLYLATIPPAEADRWLALWGELRGTRNATGRTFHFVGDKIALPPGLTLPSPAGPPEPAPPPREK